MPNQFKGTCTENPDNPQEVFHKEKREDTKALHKMKHEFENLKELVKAYNNAGVTVDEARVRFDNVQKEHEDAAERLRVCARSYTGCYPFPENPVETDAERNLFKAAEGFGRLDGILAIAAKNLYTARKDLHEISATLSKIVEA